MERIFKRKLYEKLLKWKTSRKGRTAILIEGARRVGKSTLVKHFAEREYESHIIIDFNRTSQQVKQLFDDLMDLEFIFLQLQAIYHVILKERHSVIVFDEVQKCPNARQAIKYLVEDGRYDYIETGSLISIKKNTKGITIPSEEERMTMHPLDYEEFRWALGDTATVPMLRAFYEKRQPLGAAFRTSMRDLRLYMLVGGMPQAVVAYIESNNLSRVDEVKRDIIRLYQDDFHKIDSSGRIERIFMNIPSQLSQNNNRFRPFQVLANVKGTTMHQLLNELEDSKTVLFSHNVNDPNIGMPLSVDANRFKLYCADTGLFITIVFWDKDYTENVIYQKLLTDKLSANLGYVYENLVAQMLTASGNQLFFHIWPKDDSHNYEVDFLLSRGAKVRPVEVKSSGYRTHASLDAFCKKYSHLVDQSFLVYTKDLNKEQMTRHIPVCMTPFL